MRRTDPNARSTLVAEERVAIRGPNRALDSLDYAGHARRSIRIAIDSLGIVPGRAPAHERADPASVSVRRERGLGSPTMSPA
jgi:hypothetical protein